MFPRILWAPKWLTDRTKGKRDPFEVVQRFGGLGPGEEVYAEEVTDLSQWLRGRLDREEEKRGLGAPSDKDIPVASPKARPLLIASETPTMTNSLRRSQTDCSRRRSRFTCFSRVIHPSPANLPPSYRGVKLISPRSRHCWRHWSP